MSDMTVSDDLLREVVESVSGGDASVRNLLGLMMARELIKLRDQLRWRKWPHEKPTETGCHMVRLPGKCFTMTGYWNCFEEWDLKYEWFYWMPQIPLPGGE